jgi:protein-disulfide isomerase
MNKDGRNVRRDIIWASCCLVLLAALGISFFRNQTDVYYDLPNYTQVDRPIKNIKLNYEKQPFLGDTAAKVKVVEFADFKCPACKRWTAQNMESFKIDYINTGKVQFYFMNYAFLDRDSYMAAMGGECIAKQSNEKFWEYYYKFYEHQGNETEIWATRKYVMNFVKKNIKGIDYEEFKKDMDSNTYLYDVKEDYKIAGALGVNGTPEFLVNGKLLDNSSFDSLVSEIEKQLHQ